MKSMIAAMAGIVLMAGAASAATIHLNTAKHWTSGSHTYSNGSHSVEVSAYQFYDYGKLFNGHNTLTGSWGGHHGGVGAHSCIFSKKCVPDKHTVDGSWGNEMVVFDFGDKIVRLTGVSFSYADKYDKFDIGVYGNGVGSAPTGYQYDKSLANHSPQYAAVSGLDTGSVFGVGAYTHSSDFKIKKIHYEVVPLPAAGWLLLAGIGGLAALKRRKRA